MDTCKITPSRAAELARIETGLSSASLIPAWDEKAEESILSVHELKRDALGEQAVRNKRKRARFPSITPCIYTNHGANAI